MKTILNGTEIHAVTHKCTFCNQVHRIPTMEENYWVCGLPTPHTTCNKDCESCEFSAVDPYYETRYCV